MIFAAGLTSGKHTESWKEAYEFSSSKDKQEQIEEKMEVLKDFLIRNPESYRPVLERAKTPIALDRACRSIVMDNL